MKLYRTEADREDLQKQIEKMSEGGGSQISGTPNNHSLMNS